MDAYHITLFVHISAVLAAAAAASLAVFSGGRYVRAKNHDDAHAWLELNGKTSRVFPVVLVVLLLSGSYMVSLTGGSYWSTGWVRTGVGAIVVIFAIGGFLGTRHKALERKLGEVKDARPFRAPRDPLMAILPWVNICLALGVVFVMANKPTLPNALTIAAVAVAVGLMIGYRNIAKAKAMGAALSAEAATE